MTNSKKLNIYMTSSLLVLAVAGSIHLNSLNEGVLEQGEALSRGPASVKQVERSIANRDRERAMASLIAEPKLGKVLAIIGRPSNKVEDLCFGMLEGRYAFRTSAGQVLQLRLKNQEDSPVSIQNPMQFLEKYSEAFQIDKPSLISSARKGMGRVETFRARSSHGQGHDVILQMIFDDQSRLLRLESGQDIQQL